MTYKIGLYQDATRLGEIVLDSLFVMVPADFVCQPQGVVSVDDVEQIAKILRHGPLVRAGVVGPYDWREE